MVINLSFFNSQSRKRQDWEASLAWVRVRYHKPEQLHKCIRWLTGSEKIRRLGIYFLIGEFVSQLYLGIPKQGTAVFTQMCQDYGIQRAPMPLDIEIPKIATLTFTHRLQWKRPFYAHIDGNALFIENNCGDLFPEAKDEMTTEWQLPLGKGLQPNLDLSIYNGSECAFQSSKGWPLGFGFKTQSPLMQSGRINLYGSQEATAKWLEPVALSMLSNPNRGLVVLDGVGNLVPSLKRKASVVEKLEDNLTYLDFDSHLISGFNPFSKAPFEDNQTHLNRIKTWFVQMGLPIHETSLIQKAIQTDKVNTLHEFARWVDLPDQQRMPKEIGRLKSVLNRLCAKRSTRDRLEWPTNPFTTLPEGDLLFACQQGSWEKQQIMFLILLSVIKHKQIDVILHGIEWGELQVHQLYEMIENENIIISNGPLLPNSIQIFTASHPDRAKKISRQFFNHDERIEENLNILAPGQSLLVNMNRQIAMARWSN